MLFVDYTFDLLDNGTIVMDKDLTKEKMNLKNGDKYVANVLWDGRIVFQKVMDDTTTKTDTEKLATV
jgi:hypothetical protein